MTTIKSASVFVTGAAGGIGRCLVSALLSRQAKHVYAADLAATTVAAFKGDDRVTAVDLDITDAAAVQAAAAAAQDVSILFNNAGVNLRSAFIGAPTIDAARREMDTNYFGTLVVCRAFAPILVRNAAANGGGIVNTLSILAKVTLPNLGTYCATKAALLRLTEGVRAELGPDGIQVLAVMPWAVDTPMSGPFPGEKTSPETIAEGTLDALQRGEEEVYFHDFTADINAQLRHDPKALEKSLGATFRKAR